MSLIAAPHTDAADHTTNLAGHAAELDAALMDTLKQYDVPGAAYAVAQGDEMITGGAGILNRATGYPVTADSFFQIGSITKVFTASMVMQLVDQGRIELDQPVRSYLPAFDVGDADATATITVRHLLTHTSGIQGDYFREFGRGSDAVAKYVASLADLNMLHRPGELVSYCNSGFSVLGVLLQTVTGAHTFDDLIEERLLRPLGIDGGTLPEQAIMHRVAIGHVDGPDGAAAVPAPAWALPYALGPAGTTPFMDAAGLAAFARMHLAGGVAPDGTRLLSESAVAAMQRVHMRMSTPGGVGGIGSSWVLYSYGDELVPGHDGGTLGQYSFLRVHPVTGTIAVLLTNGPDGRRLYDAVIEPVFTRLAGLPMPEQLAPVASPPPIDTARLAGTYRHWGMDLEVTTSADGLTVTTVPRADPPAADGEEPTEFALAAHSVTDDAVFLVTEQPVHGAYQCLMFPAEDPAHPGPPGYLRLGSRVFARAAS